MCVRPWIFAGKGAAAAAVLLLSTSCLSLAQGIALWSRPDVEAAREDLFRPEYYVDLSVPNSEDLARQHQRQAEYDAFLAGLYATDQPPTRPALPAHWLVLTEPRREAAGQVAGGTRSPVAPQLEALARPAAPAK